LLRQLVMRNSLAGFLVQPAGFLRALALNNKQRLFFQWFYSNY